MAAEHGHSPMDHVLDVQPAKGHIWHTIGDFSIPLLHIELFGLDFQLTKFMVLELIAAGLICAIFIPLARRAANGAPPKGIFWNMFEVLLTFIRDQVAKPTLTDPHPHHDDDGHGHAKNPDDEVDKYVPFLWTLFLFILFCNLLGMIPFGGSPTGHIWVAGALAICSFVMMNVAAIQKMGGWGYVKSYWPTMEIPIFIAVFLKPMIYVIEVFGLVIKASVLAVRLFANLFAGHLVLAYLLGFIAMAESLGVFGWSGVTGASVLGVIALSLLELFVAFLQAYIFTFLTALFMGMVIHPQH